MWQRLGEVKDTARMRLSFQCRRSGTDLWSLRIKRRHSKNLSFAAFASLRLCESRRLNEEAHLSPRRKGAKWSHLILKDQ